MTSPGPVRRLRVVVGGAGLAGEEHALEAVARALRDAGHEVIYAGPHQSPDRVVETAIQEDADLIAVCAPDDHPGLLGALTGLLTDRDAADIAVEVFAPGTTAAEVAGWIAGDAPQA